MSAKVSKPVCDMLCVLYYDHFQFGIGYLSCGLWSVLGSFS